MVEETTRQLTSKERSIVESLCRPSSSGGAGFAALLTFIVALGTLFIIGPDAWQLGITSLIPVAVALALSAGVFLRLRSRQRRNPWYQQMRQDFQAGIAKVTTYHVTDAIQVEEFEDEGSQYYLLLQDGRVAFLTGQYLYEAEEEGRFPNTVVTVARTPVTGTVLELECTGASLSVTAQRKPFSESEHREGRVPEDGEVLTIDFDTLRVES